MYRSMLRNNTVDVPLSDPQSRGEERNNDFPHHGDEHEFSRSMQIPATNR